MYSLETINFWLSLGTLVMQIVAAAFLALYFLRSKFPDLNDVGEFLGRWGLWIGFLLSFAAIVISLFYSDVIGITPCGWCWFQRIFLYPQAVLFAVAIWKKDGAIADYSIALSISGAVIALYQHYLQMGGASVIPCPATATQATDCAVRFLFEFGYITYPLMAFTVFIFLIVLMLFVRKVRD